jgi:hypothetical protein
LIGRSRQNWALLGNIGQAYGGASALISAIALVGVVGSLLIQARQHSLDRLMQLRGRQAQIYAVVREDPQLYWPVITGSYTDERAVQRWTFTIEYLQYCAARYETGLIPEQSLRNEMFPAFFRLEDNRVFWDSVKEYWIESAATKKRWQFVMIANEELAKVRARGTGLSMPYQSDNVSQHRRVLGSRWRLSAVAGAGAVSLAILLVRRCSHTNDGQ